MSSRADFYRQRAAEAKKSAARASNPSAKSAFVEVAKGWLLLAEQMEWIDRERERKTGPEEPSSEVFPYQQTLQDTVVDAPMRFEIFGTVLPSPLKNLNQRQRCWAWDDGGLIMHCIMSALAFSFLFALLFGLI